MAEAQIAAYRTYGHDSVGVGPGSTGIAEAIGSKVAFPEQSTPFIAEHAVKHISDLDELEVPDPRRDGRFPVFLAALKILVEELGEEVPVSLTVGGPTSTAGNLRGTENLLRDLYYHPEFAHRLLRYAVDSTIPFVEEAAKLGVKFGIVDPVASGSLISPKQYREFALPYQKELIDAMKRVGGASPMLHICGNTKRIWQDMADTGVVATAALLQELGMEVIGMRAFHYDHFGDDLFNELPGKETIPVNVATGQPFEQANLLEKLKPDIYLGHTGGNGWAAKHGVPILPIFSPINTYMGYAGVFEIARRLVRLLKNPSFNRNLAANTRQPYFDKWFEQDPYSYINPVE